MKGIIVLEGADGCGKTTLAKEICRQYNGYYMHADCRWLDNMFNYHLAIVHRAVKKSMNQLVVIDRLWPSEDIYSTVYRDGPHWPYLGRFIDRILRRFGAIYVFCLMDNEKEYEKRYEKLKETRKEKFDNTIDVFRRYANLWYGDQQMAGYDYSVLITQLGGFQNRDDSFLYRYDKEGQALNVFLQLLISKLRIKYDCLPNYAVDATNYNLLGHVPTAKWLIVGDKINKEKRQADYPWMGYKNSSLFLTACLHRLGIDERHLCYVNRNDPLGEMIIDDIMMYYKVKPIYLGANARKRMRAREVFHPAYAYRFGKHAEFVEQLHTELT